MKSVVEAEEVAVDDDAIESAFLVNCIILLRLRQ